MISFSPIALFSFNLGPSVTAIGKLGLGHGEVTRDQIKELRVPWQKLLPDQKLFSLLSWHTRVSEFAGRDDEMDQLKEWATSDHPVWVKFVVGEGGVGKSRLGAEFAEMMQKKDWAAGFGDLRDPHAFPMKEAGTLLVIDYPEEHVERVKELLKDLTNVSPDVRLRVLFLTRQTPDNWAEVISAAHAQNVVDQRYITLRSLDVQSAMTIFNTTVTEAGSKLQGLSAQELGRALIHEKPMEEWLKQRKSPENERALFIMAAAVHSAENPDEEVVSFSGREVVKALVEREVMRYQGIAEDRTDVFKNKYALARLLAMAAIADELSIADIQKISESDLPVGFQPDVDNQGELMTAGLLIDGKVTSPTPDIVAAAFMVDVLGRRPEHAPEIVWAALKDDIDAGLERIGRLCYDAEIVLGIHDPCLSDWLAEAVEGKADRCSILDEYLWEAGLPLGWLRTAIAVYRTLLNHAEDDENRARFLNNLSNDLSATGDTAGALVAIQEAVRIRRRLAKANPARFKPDLAASLNNLSSELSATGDRAGALAAIQEAVEIYRRLAEANPARFEPNLAKSLNNLSNSLSDTGDTTGALAAIQEAVEIYHRLAEANPARFEPDLAGSLNNLSNRLSDTGDTAGALAAIQEAVEIRRRLAKANPARFEPDLATNLNNLSGALSTTGDRAGGLVSIQEAVEIRRRLAEASPARFEPDLAGSLNNLSNRLSDTGDTAGALAAVQEAVEIRRRLAETNPARFEPDLASSLNNLSADLSDTGDTAGALEAIQEAAEIYRRLAEANPARFEPYLALSLNNLSADLSDTGDTVGALAAIQEAVKICRRLAEANPARFEPDLALSVGVLGDVFTAMKQYSNALEAYKEAEALIRPYAKQWPGSRHEELLKDLQDDLRRASSNLQS